MEIPISEESLKRTLTEQVNFIHEKKNLEKFIHNFKDSKDVKFPFPIAERTTDAVLVETFIEGLPITYYEKNKHPLNKVIARIGTMTFFEMLIKNNFIHADCHGGNILVQIKPNQKYNFFTEATDFAKEIYYFCERKLGACFYTEAMKKLYIESKI